MKYGDVIEMMRGGIQAISSRTLDIGDAYSVVKFKSAIKKAFVQIQEKEEQIFKDVGVEDIPSFFNKRNDLLNKKNRDAIDEGQLQKYNEQYNRFTALQNVAHKEDVVLEGLTPLSFEAWRILQDTNKDVKANGGTELLCFFEADLEGILWKMTDTPNKTKE